MTFASTVHITIHLDGNTSESGYKFIVTQGFQAFCAFKTDAGFRNFLRVYGLTIDPTRTELKDYTKQGKGRVLLCQCHPKHIMEHYFWSMAEVPPAAMEFTGLCNGSYVDCYALDLGDAVNIYRPNPNAKEVYCLKALGGAPCTTAMHIAIAGMIG